MTSKSCSSCRAVLSAWEYPGCSCRGPRCRTNQEVLYAIACEADAPLRTADFVRIAARDHGVHMGTGTATAVLAPDPRFCWAGRGLYGLYRHGPLPGPRNLEHAARVVLVAAGRPLDAEVVDYCLKQLGYRFSSGSLRNAVGRSASISWSWMGHWDHPRGDSAQLSLREDIPVVPPRRRAAWIELRDEVATQIKALIRQRDMRLRALADVSRFGIDWE